MANNNIGPKRLVVGAHYGLKDWLLQRVTAVIMIIFTLILLVAFLLGDSTYDAWAGLFANQIMKLITFLAIASLTYHAWVGIRDIWMDYIKPVGIRLTLHVLTALWLIACLSYTAQILWRV
jgi:succinate dehydrogenase / fumarate reductase membrane anchor subunit